MRWSEKAGTSWFYATIALLTCGGFHPAFAASCSLTEAVDAIQLDDLKQEASNAPQENAILGKMEAISAKAKNPNLPIDTQLDADDMEEFGELRARFIHQQDYNITQSNRARDAEVVLDMFNVALKSYSDPTYDEPPPPPTDLPQSPGIAVIYLRYMQPTQFDYVPSTDTTCTIDFALSQEQAQVIQQIDANIPVFQRDKPLIDALRAKYGISQGGQLDPSKMSPDDVQTLDLLQNEIKPAMNDLTLNLDLSNIRSWWQMAQLAYYDDLQDGEKGDDTTDVGGTLKAQEATFSPVAQAMFKMWVVVDEKVPDQDAVEFQQMQTILQKMAQH